MLFWLNADGTLVAILGCEDRGKPCACSVGRAIMWADEAPVGYIYVGY